MHGNANEPQTHAIDINEFHAAFELKHACGKLVDEACACRQNLAQPL